MRPCQCAAVQAAVRQVIEGCAGAQVGRLWTAMADYYIRKAMFERARDVYEEGLNAVVTVRDFSLVFDAFTQFEESLLTAKMEAEGDGEEGKEAEGEGDGEDFLLIDDGNDLDLR